MKGARTLRPAGAQTRPGEAVAPRSDGSDPLWSSQRALGNGAFARLIGTPWIQAKPDTGSRDDPGEREPDQAAEVVTVPPPGSSEAELAPTGLPEEATAERDDGALRAREPTTGAALIVDDDAVDLQAGQMRKSELLGQLRISVGAAAEQALAGTVWSAAGCPYIERAFTHYADQPAGYVERALRKYAPDAAGARTARDYIPLVTERVRRGMEEWRRTGEISGAPEDLPQEGMPVVGAAGLVGGVLAGIGDVAGGLVGGAGSAVSGLGRVLFKGRAGGALDADPEAVRGRLRSGHALDGRVRGRMESVFGVSFGGVRIHTDATAHHLSDSLNARAFTIGDDIAFGSREYQPGTLIGEALIAHELAHVVQQRSRRPNAAQPRGGAYHALEEDADGAALRAVASLHGRSEAVAPRLRSGLRLQRCGGADAKKPAAAPGLQTDKALRQTWDVAFREGLDLLNASVAKKGKERGCAFPGNKREADWAYDDVNWRQVRAGEGAGSFKVGYEPRKAPHVSVDELFSHLERWECDCALFAELTWLYAWRHSLSNEEFDAKFGNLRLMPQESIGLERETHRRESIELGLEGGNFDEMWASAPLGTKVNWRNESVHARSPWEFENAVKSRKGRTPDQDRYDAYPLGPNLTEEQVKRGLAENSEDFPGRPFVITEETVKALKVEGAPPDFIKSLEGLKGQSFFGKKEFLKALSGPVQALVPLRAQDPARYHVILEKTFDTAHLVPTEQDKRQYVEQYIRRHEIQIPK